MNPAIPDSDSSMPGGTTPVIRAAQTEDAAAIAAIYNQYIGSGPFTMETMPWTQRSVTEKIGSASEREVWTVVDDSVNKKSLTRNAASENGGSIVGWGQLKRYSERAGYRICCEVSLYLDRQEVGRGTGGTLMKSLIADARRLDYRHIVSKIIAGNESSIRFHHRHGFETVGVQREIGIVDGKFADVMILQLILES